VHRVRFRCTRRQLSTLHIRCGCMLPALRMRPASRSQGTCHVPLHQELFLLTHSPHPAAAPATSTCSYLPTCVLLPASCVLESRPRAAAPGSIRAPCLHSRIPRLHVLCTGGMNEISGKCSCAFISRMMRSIQKCNKFFFFFSQVKTGSTLQCGYRICLWSMHVCWCTNAVHMHHFSSTFQHYL
jgi:hypothetical protein